MAEILDALEDQIVEEFRGWLAEHRRADWEQFERHRVTMEQRAVASREWEALLGRDGWLGLTWPREYGGRGVSLRAAALITKELAASGAPELFNQVGLDLVGPALVRYGTDEQKARFLPGLLRGEIWCQGFSEPDAGSDLASLRTRAECRGGRYTITGQKVWSTFASAAEYCILLARTDPDAPKHRGISCFLLSMKTPGLTLRPIRDITGDAEFFELFLDNCVLDEGDLLGDAGQGWNIAMNVLATERSSIFSLLEVVQRDANYLVELIRALPGDVPGRAEMEATAAWLFARNAVVQWSNERATELVAAGCPDARLEALMKVSWSELHQELVYAAIDAGGLATLVEGTEPEALDEGRWLFSLLRSRAETIYAGTSQIQRDIIAERILRLPRETRL